MTWTEELRSLLTRHQDEIFGSSLTPQSEASATPSTEAFEESPGPLDKGETDSSASQAVDWSGLQKAIVEGVKEALSFQKPETNPESDGIDEWINRPGGALDRFTKDNHPNSKEE